MCVRVARAPSLLGAWPGRGPRASARALGLRGAQVPRGGQPDRAAKVQAGQALRTRRAAGRTNSKCVSNSRGGFTGRAGISDGRGARMGAGVCRYFPGGCAGRSQSSGLYGERSGQRMTIASGLAGPLVISLSVSSLLHGPQPFGLATAQRPNTTSRWVALKDGD